MKSRSVFILVLTIFLKSLNADKKNILFILSDDLGFNDPSFRGNNEILTPNIDALFYSGVTLNRSGKLIWLKTLILAHIETRAENLKNWESSGAFWEFLKFPALGIEIHSSENISSCYTAPLCTPSRASLMTGKFAHRIGMQHETIQHHQPWALGMDQKLFPQYFKEAGYETHAVGKWHLGFFQPQYTPTNRGFDTFFGHYGGSLDYFDRTFTLSPDYFPNFKFTAGYDFRNNLEVDRSDAGMYMTDLITKKTVEIIENHKDEKPFFIYLAHTAVHRSGNESNPLPAKDEDLQLYEFIEKNDRKHYAAMIKSLDDSVGEVVEALSRSNKLKDTIIVFTTDNGGPTRNALISENSASNYPLRSQKGSAWEGGTRVGCVIYASWLPSGVKRENYFHISDWLTTLSNLANSSVKIDRELDGMDLSKMITTGEGPFRQDIETIDQVTTITSIIHGSYKLMNSTFVLLNGTGAGWLGKNDHADRESDSYTNRVLNSKVALSFRIVNNSLNETTINEIRNSLKVSCNDQEEVKCDIINKRCLFKIDEDPCERKNLAEDPEHANILKDMMNRLDVAMTKVVPPRNQPGDNKSDPSLHDRVWSPWQPDYIPENSGNKLFGKGKCINIFVLTIITFLIQYFIFKTE